MSQFYVGLSAGSLPPTVATSYQTDNGTATPASNIIKINGKESNINNDNGIIVNGGVVGTGTSNEIDIVLTNRITGTVTTNNATPVVLVSDNLGVIPGCYYLEGNITVFNVTDTIGASYSFESAAYTDGIVGTEIGTEEKSVFEPPSMSTADFSVSILANIATVTVTGVAGKTLHWNGFFTYRFVS